MTFMLQINDSISESRLIKESVSEGWSTGDDPSLKHDFYGVYGQDLWNSMEDLYSAFPYHFGCGANINEIDGNEWDIRLVEDNGIDLIELGVRSTFSATNKDIKTRAKYYYKSLLERFKDYKALPKKRHPGLPIEAESGSFLVYFPLDELKDVAEILSQGFPEGDCVSPRPLYAEQRNIKLHDVPTNPDEAEDFICEFSTNCSDYDDLIDHLDWDEDTLRDPRKIFDVEIALYLPVITPEIQALNDRGEETGLPWNYTWPQRK